MKSSERKNKKNRVTIIILYLVILFLSGLLICQRSYYRSMCWEMQKRGDSLEFLQGMREGNQLPYLGLSYDSIRQLLPLPAKDTLWKFVGKLKSLDQYSWPARKILSGFKKTDADTVIMRFVVWNLPYNDLPNLFIGFVQDSNRIWYAEDCVQWSEMTMID